MSLVVPGALVIQARAARAIRKRDSTYLVFHCPVCGTRNKQVEHAGTILDKTHIALRCHRCHRKVEVGPPVHL